ncbi:hypothetical protein N7530_004008 [Penicillium desertorum]|uniref:Uncharacterized protein n=1 Tax=Penicillium desertorum TaxID=1303715 RepID=A0A9W9WXG4_9EURO|nr:hypothetical protein N7530_004008 [Penicillium desertorum]
MASFMEDLWSSIFTPGPTPTLLIATNVTFAALQIIFFALLLATYSLHFVALSIISGGLWWAINWFAAEVRLAQQAQEAEKEKQESGDAKTKNPAVGESADSETETEAIVAKKTGDKSAAVATGSAASGLLPTARDPKKRPSTGGEGSGYGSTDSEWEKVDDTQS